MKKKIEKEVCSLSLTDCVQIFLHIMMEHSSEVFSCYVLLRNENKGICIRSV